MMLSGRRPLNPESQFELVLRSRASSTGTTTRHSLAMICLVSERRKGVVLIRELFSKFHLVVFVVSVVLVGPWKCWNLWYFKRGLFSNLARKSQPKLLGPDIFHWGG